MLYNYKDTGYFGCGYSLLLLVYRQASPTELHQSKSYCSVFWDYVQGFFRPPIQQVRFTPSYLAVKEQPNIKYTLSFLGLLDRHISDNMSSYDIIHIEEKQVSTRVASQSWHVNR